MVSASGRDFTSKISAQPFFGESDSESDGGSLLKPYVFQVNQEFAERFEHNKKREEHQKLEEKFGKDLCRTTEDGATDDNDSSLDETEDEDGFLATEDLDAQISATLHAIRTKDPRVYDQNVTFVQLPDELEPPAATKEKVHKPVFLRDYQRERILRSEIGDDFEAPMTYMQEQDALKKSIVSEMHAALPEDDSDGSDDDAFMKRKEPEKADVNGFHYSRTTKLNMSELDVINADKNPELFLSNYMASRAWIPEAGGKFQAFDSDENDDQDDEVAEKWEEAYNMRFEHPAKSKEVLTSYARDFAAARSVRREEKTGRKRQRELERERKAEEKRKRREERARLRKLKLEDVEEKLRKVKEAAGAVGKSLHREEWIQFLDDAWDNDRWEEEMRKRFGDEYYAMDDNDAAKSDEDAAVQERELKKKEKRKGGPKKPKWHDDIDIKDIVPDFADDARPPMVLIEDDDERPSKKRKTDDGKRARLEAQRVARQERSRLEALVDSQLSLGGHALLAPPAAGTTFRYRETSPQAFGMTARDILLAPSDQALNAFAGLKKLAPFRDAAKKRRDRKHLGKKARLRDWRRDTFGRQFERDGPTYGLERLLAADDADADADADDGSSRQRHRRRGSGADAQTRSLAAESAERPRPSPGAGTEDQAGGVGGGGGRKKNRKRSKDKARATAETV